MIMKRLIAVCDSIEKQARNLRETTVASLVRDNNDGK